MSYNDSITVQAGADLTAFRYRALAIGGTLATGLNARGVNQDKPESGENTSIVYQGRSRFIAGGAVAAGARVQVTSGGFMTTVVSGGQSVGFNENAAVGSGAVGRGVFNFASAGEIIG